MDEMDIVTQWYRDGDIQRKSAPGLGWKHSSISRSLQGANGLYKGFLTHELQPNQPGVHSATTTKEPHLGLLPNTLEEQEAK